LIAASEDSGSASSFGFKAAAQYAFAQRSRFFANYEFIDGAIDHKDANENEQVLAGNTFRWTSKHSFAIGFTINPKINENLEFFFKSAYI
jgi:iron complex outermembrane receptor protein